MLLWLMNSHFPLLHSDIDFKATSGKQIATPILADKIDPKKNTMILQIQYRSLKRLGSLPKIWNIQAGFTLNRTLVLQFCLWPSKLFKLVWCCMLMLILKLPSKSSATTKASNFTSRRMVLPEWWCISVEFGMLAWQPFQNKFCMWF